LLKKLADELGADEPASADNHDFHDEPPVLPWKLD
jgi:hypothetical protein